MKMTKIIAVSTFAIVLSACSQTSSQTQVEGAAPAVVSGAKTGPAHIHNVQGHGDFSHQHQGNSTANHGHSWDQIQSEINKP